MESNRILRESRRFIDAHVHLDAYAPEETEAMLDRFRLSGGAAVVAVSMHLASCIETRALARRYPGLVHPAYGFHPEQPLPGEAQLDELFGWIRARHEAGDRFAIGEVGLPYYTRTEAAEQGLPFDEEPYLRLLDRFAALAAELDRPLALHAVYEDGGKACDILERHNVRRAHFHWFKGDEATVRRMIANGYYISVTPDVAYEPEIIQLAGRYPIELMMAETDGPWPFEGPFAGRKTEPAMAAEAARRVALLKGLPREDAERRLFGNAAAFYGL